MYKQLFIFALLKTTDHREFFFNYSDIKFVFNFQFEKSFNKVIVVFKKYYCYYCFIIIIIILLIMTLKHIVEKIAR